ncbi:MAG: Frr, ribosome recycling factor [Candidatus Parcubacteria bacterium]|nr:Frr, ribosome recycling factor [Candidatus Parcubacteria bacterium]
MAYDLNPFKKQLAGTEEWLKKELQQVRTGQASPAILDGVRVEVYGAPMALKEVASVMIEGARTLRVTPWDKAQVKEIEKAITVANLGLSVAVDDQGVRVNFPELTSDRRKDFAKLAKDKLEESKKQIRQHRDGIVKDLTAKEKEGGYGKDEIFRLKGEVQKVVDDFNKKFEDLYAKKEKEILN